MDTIPYDIFDTLPRDCWLTIDAARLTSNFRILKKAAGVKALGVLKANGYGHGYANVARAFLAGGADYLGVATLSEGLLLRRLGFTCPLLIICGMLPPEMVVAAEAGIDFFVWHADHMAPLAAMGAKQLPVRVHLKVDTGMGRGGCLPHDAPQLAEQLSGIKGVKLTGLATHFASADVTGVDDTDRQIKQFDRVLAALTAKNIRPPLVHASNSPGTLYFPRAAYDMVRLGITAYGVPPDDGMPIPDGVATALTWQVKITSTKVLPAGHGVGYGSEYKMPREGRMGVLPVGYADGYRRTPKGVNTVLVEGQERKILGRVCMDQCMVDLDGFGDLTGAEVVLIGKQGKAALTPDDLARRWNTNAYDVMTGIAARVPRRLIER